MGDEDTWHWALRISLLAPCTVLILETTAIVAADYHSVIKGVVASWCFFSLVAKIHSPTPKQTAIQVVARAAAVAIVIHYYHVMTRVPAKDDAATMTVSAEDAAAAEANGTAPESPIVMKAGQKVRFALQCET